MILLAWYSADRKGLSYLKPPRVCVTASLEQEALRDKPGMNIL